MTRNPMSLRSALLLAVAAGTAAASPGDVRLISVGPASVQGNSISQFASISDDGALVGFQSFANNLVAGDTNNANDAFVRNDIASTTTLESRSSAGVLGAGISGTAIVSGDGLFVVFESAANNLVAGDTNGFSDVFRRDLTTGVTELVSRSTSGGFGNNTSNAPSVSANGRYVAFESTASNLIASDTNGQRDIFVRDMTLGTTIRVSISSAGVQAASSSTRPAISRDGQYIAFDSLAANLVTGDTNGVRDVFVRDRINNTTVRASLNSAGIQANDTSNGPHAISSDGRFVAFQSFSNNLVTGDSNFSADIFVRDMVAGTTERVTQSSAGVIANAGSFAPSISGNGRFVAYMSQATNLVPADTNARRDIFVHDRLLALTKLVSRAPGGLLGNGDSDRPAISADAKFLAFDTLATNLPEEDTNGFADVLIVELRCPADINGDGSVDLADFFAFFDAYDVEGPAADITGDGTTDLSDFFAFFTAYDAEC